MKIIIPMAGTGQRFVDAGYKEPKPLIRLNDNRRILEHVLDMFPGDHEFVFICNEDHILKTDMMVAIYMLRGKSQIVEMPSHKKGPVFTVMAALDNITDTEEVIVSYCDGTLKWNLDTFHHSVNCDQLDGCLLTHTGFHPHTLSNTKMAFVKLHEDGKRVVEVKEKSCYTDNPMQEHASSGVYYFRRGDILKKYFKEAMEKDVSYNGEYYVTLVYNLLIKDGLRVGFYDTDHVAILGTPEEVRNFESWRTIVQNSKITNDADVVKLYNYWKTYWNGHTT
jgi:NDP-sugar pyrophosphorylase family protein